MKNNSGWIKSHRQKLKWEWFTMPSVAHFFEYCCLKANFVEGNFRGIVVPVGSFVSSLEKMAQETGLSIQQVRTAIKYLRKTQELTQQATSRYTVITVNNWHEYQGEQQTNNKQITNKQQTNNNNIRIKEGKNNKVSKDTLLGEGKVQKFTPPSFEEVQIYCLERNNGIDAQTFIDFYSARGWLIGKNKMKDWKAAVRTWENRRKEEVKKSDITAGMEFK